MTFRFIAAEKASYPIRLLCRTLAVSPSGYYAWHGRQPSARAHGEVRLRHAVRVAYAESGGATAAPVPYARCGRPAIGWVAIASCD